jgi:hypothetical protein
VILLQLDLHIPVLVRQRLLVAFNPWRGRSMLLHYSKVCEVCQSTGYVKNGPLWQSDPIGIYTSDQSRSKAPSGFALSSSFFARILNIPSDFGARPLVAGMVARVRPRNLVQEVQFLIIGQRWSGSKRPFQSRLRICRNLHE